VYSACPSRAPQTTVTIMSDDSNNAAFPQGPVAFPNASTPTSSWLPPRYQAIGQGAGLINQGAQAVGRGVASGLMAVNKAIDEIGGPKPAY
jgi:hypothetical protein